MESISNKEEKKVNANLFEYFIYKKADVNVVDYFGQSPLHYMVNKNFLLTDYIEVLLHLGADVNLKDKKKSFFTTLMNKEKDKDNQEDSGIFF